MTFAVEKLFSVSEHCEYLDPCQGLNRNVQNSAPLRKEMSFSQVTTIEDQRNLLNFFYCTQAHIEGQLEESRSSCLGSQCLTVFKTGVNRRHLTHSPARLN